jgi:glyoxylase-like metal-dependent hydrolase (beta-lactamase superfamily II)
MPDRAGRPPSVPPPKAACPTALVRRMEEKLYLITLPPPLPGYDNFIGIWLYTGPPAVLVDVGPSAASASLLRALTSIGVRALDYLLMTHVHIDHAGGIGDLAEAFPRATIVGHTKGLPHLVHPERLWRGSLKTLGSTARGYGPVRPVAADRVMDAAALEDSRLRVIPTPGHSPHHISYGVEDILFVGEAGGVCLATADPQPYMRPATPPRFFLDVALASLERLIAAAPPKLAYSHFGLFDAAPTLLQSHRDQLLLWLDVIDRTSSKNTEGDLVGRCLENLLQSDARLKAYGEMSTAARRREERFLRNSIEGFWGYLQRMAGSS